MHIYIYKIVYKWVSWIITGNKFADDCFCTASRVVFASGEGVGSMREQGLVAWRGDATWAGHRNAAPMCTPKVIHVSDWLGSIYGILRTQESCAWCRANTHPWYVHKRLPTPFSCIESRLAFCRDRQRAFLVGLERQPWEPWHFRAGANGRHVRAACVAIWWSKSCAAASENYGVSQLVSIVMFIHDLFWGLFLTHRATLRSNR